MTGALDGLALENHSAPEVRSVPNPRVPETIGGGRKSTGSSKGSQVQILSARLRK